MEDPCLSNRYSLTCSLPTKARHRSLDFRAVMWLISGQLDKVKSAKGSGRIFCFFQKCENSVKQSPSLFLSLSFFFLTFPLPWLALFLIFKHSQYVKWCLELWQPLWDHEAIGRRIKSQCAKRWRSDLIEVEGSSWSHWSAKPAQQTPISWRLC